MIVTFNFHPTFDLMFRTKIELLLRYNFIKKKQILKFGLVINFYNFTVNQRPWLANFLNRGQNQVVKCD